MILESMSMVTRPVKPNAVVWYNPGRYSMAHFRISCGGSEERDTLMVSRSSFERGSCRGLVRLGDKDIADVFVSKKFTCLDDGILRVSAWFTCSRMVLR